MQNPYIHQPATNRCSFQFLFWTSGKVKYHNFFEPVEKSNIIILNIFHFSATPTPRKAIVQLNILALLNLISIDCDDKDGEDEDDFFWLWL